MAFGVVAVVIVVGIGAYLMSQGSKDMRALTQGQIAGYASNAGFQGEDLLIATAIAQAESSGDSQALGDPTLGISVGLWQINLHAHPEYTQVELYDPQANANAAYDIYATAGNSFHPWSTYKSGAYQQYLAEG